MIASFQIYKGPSLWFYIKRSILLHCECILLFFFITYVVSFFFDQKVEDMDYLKQAVRVDLVEMPKYTLEELRELKPVPAKEDKMQETKEEVSEEDKREDLSKSEEAELEDLMQKLVKKGKKKNEAIKEKLEVDKLKKEKLDKINQLVLSGNKILEGQQVEGDQAQYDLQEFDRYVLKMTENVRRYWQLPSYLQGLKVKCRIQVYIELDGKLRMAKIIESSGQTEFDERALAAIKQATPFEVPSEKIAPKLLKGLFILGFPL